MWSYRNLALALCLLLFQHWAKGISDCGFYTPIVLPNCSMKSIESADFYENGVSPAQPFMITLWPRDEGLCCQNCSSNNCWLLTKTTSNCKEKSQNCNLQEIRNYRLAGSQDKNSHNCFTSTFHLHCSIFPSVLCLHFKCLCEAGLCSLFAAPPIKVTTGQ